MKQPLEVAPKPLEYIQFLLLHIHPVPTLKTILARRPKSPVVETEQAEKHSAKVGKVGNVAIRVESQVGFENGIANDEPFGLDRNGREEEKNPLVGIKQTEGQENAVASTASTNRSGVGRICREYLHNYLAKTRAYTTDKIECQEAIPAQRALNDPSKQPQRVHIEKDMRGIGVEEHIGDQLPQLEIDVEMQTPIVIIEYGVERALVDY